MTDIAKRKLELQEEIDVAEAKLLSNIDNLNVGKYLTPHLSSITSIGAKALSNPSDTVANLDVVARQLFDDDNIFRRVFKYLNLGIKSYNLLFSKN